MSAVELDRISDLRALNALRRATTLSGAARELGISQPGLSKTLARIEAQLGRLLVERGRRGLRWTSDGDEYWTRIEPLLSSLDAYERSAQKIPLRGSVRIGASDNLAHYVLPDLIQRFWITQPDVALEVVVGTSAKLMEDVSAGRIEAAYCFRRPNRASIRFRRIAEVPFAIVFSSENVRLREAAQRRDEDALRRSYYFGSRRSEYGSDNPALQLLAQKGIDPILAVQTNSQELQKRLVTGRYGYTVVPQFMVRQEVALRTLRIWPGSESLSWPVYRLSHKGRRGDRAADAVIEYLDREIRTVR